MGAGRIGARVGGFVAEQGRHARVTAPGLHAGAMTTAPRTRGQRFCHRPAQRYFRHGPRLSGYPHQPADCALCLSALQRRPVLGDGRLQFVYGLRACARERCVRCH